MSSVELVWGRTEFMLITKVTALLGIVPVAFLSRGEMAAGPMQGDTLHS